MRSKKLYIMAGLTLVLALLVWWGYSTYFGPDPQVQQQLNDQFGPEFFTSVAGDAPAGDAQPGNRPVTTTILQKIEEQRAARIKATPSDVNVAPAQGSEEAIISKYVPQFRALENLATSRMNALFNAAVQEYRQQQAAGTLNLGELAHKYIQAGTTLEANVDGQFYSSLNAMQAELVANNQSTAIISEVKKEYATAKSNRRAEILAKARRK